MSKIVECKNLTVKLDRKVVLEDISVGFADKELSVIFGPNGAGKSTLLKVIIGQLHPDSGEILLLGQNVVRTRRYVGYVPQNIFSKRNFPITVLDLVLMGRYGHVGLFRRPKKADRDIALSALDQVGLASTANLNLSELSGGQRQRVYLARALAGEPRVLILDEATSGVDIGAKESLHELLIRLKQNMAVIFVTHDMSVVSLGVDNIVCLNRRLVSHGKPDEALNDEALKCMYGEHVSVFSHCSAPHIHVSPHDER